MKARRIMQPAGAICASDNLSVSVCCTPTSGAGVCVCVCVFCRAFADVATRGTRRLLNGVKWTRSVNVGNRSADGSACGSLSFSPTCFRYRLPVDSIRSIHTRLGAELRGSPRTLTATLTFGSRYTHELRAEPVSFMLERVGLTVKHISSNYLVHLPFTSLAYCNKRG